jgi:hypothetical protein
MTTQTNMAPFFDSDQYPLTVVGLDRLQYLIEDAANAVEEGSWTSEQTASFGTLIFSRDEYPQVAKDLIPQLRRGEVYSRALTLA